jgi:hypothetical protein
MKNVNTAAQNTAEEITAIEGAEVVLTAEQKAAVEAEADALVQEVIKGDKLNAAKKAAGKRDWINIAAAGAMSAIMSTGDMVVNNLLEKSVHGDDAKQYSVLEIAGVGLAAAVVGSGVRAAVDYVPQVNGHEGVALVATSLSANVAFVGSAFARDSILNTIKGKLATVDVEVLAEEA